jgi:hypothetical protein
LEDRAAVDFESRLVCPVVGGSWVRETRRRGNGRETYTLQYSEKMVGPYKESKSDPSC